MRVLEHNKYTLVETGIFFSARGGATGRRRRGRFRCRGQFRRCFRNRYTQPRRVRGRAAVVRARRKQWPTVTSRDYCATYVRQEKKKKRQYARGVRGATTQW